MSEARWLQGRSFHGATAAPVWREHVTALAELAGAILVLFHRDVGGMVVIWWTSSTYGHCLLIPFIIGWLVWLRRDDLRVLTPGVSTTGLTWIGFGSAVWLAGEAGGLAVLRHLAVIIMLQGAVVTMLGTAAARTISFPLFYAFFLVPMGSELEPELQLLTAEIATWLLRLAGVPAHIDGIFITIPNGYFRVAEACSGAKFVVAMGAYGVLLSHLCFRSWLRRTIFMVSALAVCIFANGVRAFATIYVAHETGIDAAVGFDHVVYGWIFFAVVMAGLIAAAWPFFDRHPGDRAATGPVPQQPVSGTSLPSAVAVALLVLIAAPTWSWASSTRNDGLLAPKLPRVAGWHRVARPSAYPWEPHFAGADYRTQARYGNDLGQVVDLAIVTYARQLEGHELIGFGQGAAGPDSGWSWSSPAWSPAGALGEVIVAPGPVERHVVSFYRVGAAPLTGSAAEVKLDTMKARLFLRDQRAIAILVSAEDREGAPADRAIGAFLSSIGDIDKIADASLRGR